MHCEPCGSEIDLRPAQRHEFGDAQSMPEAHQDCQCVAAAMSTPFPGGLDQPLDLRWRQVFALAATLSVRAATGGHSLAVTSGGAWYCSQSSGWHACRSFAKH